MNIQEFSIGGIAIPKTDLVELVSHITDEVKRAEILESAKSLVPSGIRYVTEDDNTKDPARTVIASSILNRHLLLE